MPYIIENILQKCISCYSLFHSVFSILLKKYLIHDAYTLVKSQYESISILIILIVVLPVIVYVLGNFDFGLSLTCFCYSISSGFIYYYDFQ